MPDISTAVAIVVIAGLVVVALVIVLARGGRLRSFRLDVLKGMLGFDGTLDTQSVPAGTPVLSVDSEVPDLAHNIIAWLREQQPQRVRGCYVLTDTTQDNAKTAARLYSRVDGEVIGTCFFESPYYGRGDFAATINEKSKFTRLTITDVCDDATAKQVQDVFTTMPCQARLVIVPNGVEVSKIGGIFCHLSDRSFLAFIALNNVQDTSSNRGLVFSGTLAQELFAYFKGFADKLG
jgi:hypothetical protein